MSTPVPTSAESHARPSSPYKGLASFEDSEFDELLFFGREHEREVIAANVVATRLTVLYGPSGVGKSSVLRAGVARDLRALPERPLVIICDAWTDSPDHSLASAIAAAAGIEPGPLAETVEVAAALHGEIYLLLDQVEEYFVYHGVDPALGDALAELVTRPELPVHVLVGIREDALARLDSFKRRLPGLLANRLRLDHLSASAGRRAILGPVERFGALVPEEEGLAVEPQLVDAVLAGVRTGVLVQPRRGRGAAKAERRQDRIETPYLQVVMQRLWEVERERGSRVLQYSTLEGLGGPARIVEEHLERALTTLTPEQKGLAARMFNHLVTPSGMKIAHGRRDLAGYTAASEDELEPVLVALGRERILRPVGGDGPDVAHEIFHDVLADAVLAWRAAFEAEEALRRERASARRRHRRLVVFVAVSLVALAAMAAVTLYAFGQRSSAQRNATAAQKSRAEAQNLLISANSAKATAQRQALKAKLAQHEAELAKHDALVRAKQARVAQKEAVKQKRAADAANLEAQRQRQDAVKQKQFADTQKQEALKQKGIAEQKSRLALTEKQKADAKAQEALRAKAKADRARVAAKSGEFAYNALTLLGSDPEQSLRLGVKAAALNPKLPLIERTLRQALLATRGLHVLAGGGGAVGNARFSPDGKLIVITDATDARVFAADSGRLVSTIHAPTNVRSATFSPDGRTILTAFHGRHAELWDPRSGSRVGSFARFGAVTTAAFSVDGRLAVTTRGAIVRIWDVASRSLLLQLVAPATVRRPAFSPDGSRLLTIAGDAAYVFDVMSGALLFPLPQPSRVTDARFSAQGDLIATTGVDHTAQLWNARDGSLRCTTPASDGDLLSSGFSHDAQWLVTVSTQGDSRVWTTSNCQLATMLVGQLSKVVAAEFSPDDKLIVTAGSDGSARLFSFPDGVQQARLLGHREALTSARFSPDGTRVVTGSNDGTARIWNAEVDRLLQPIGTHQGSASGLAFSPDGETLASVGADGDVRLWNLETRSERAPLVAGVPLNGVAFSPDGRKLAAAGADGITRVWSLAGGRLTATKAQPGAALSVAFSPNSAWLATVGDDHNLRIWAVKGGQATLVPQPGAVHDVAFSPDSGFVATAGEDGVARLWNRRTGKLEQTFSGHVAALTSVSFSPDGSRLLTTSLDHDARIWDVASGQSARVLHGHAALVSDGGFSADGNWVVTAGPGKAGVWSTSGTDLPSFRLFFLAGHQGPVTAAAFAPHGWTLATAGSDGTIRTYTCALCAGTPELVHLANQRLQALKPA